MGRTLASASFQCGYEKDPAPSVSVQLDPPLVAAHNGALVGVKVFVEMSVGGKRVNPDGLAPLAETGYLQFDSVTGLRWEYLTGDESGRVGYRLMAVPLKQDLMLSSYVTYGGEEYPFTLQVQRNDDGQKGDDAVGYDLQISPDAWTLDANGKSPFAYVNRYPKVKVYRTAGEARTDVSESFRSKVSGFTLKMVADEAEVTDGLSWEHYGEVVNGIPVYKCFIRPVNAEGVPYRSVTIEAYKDGVLLASKSCSIAQDGDPGPFTPPPMRWEDYEDEFLFTDGTGGTPKYVVLHGQDPDGKFPAYVCIKSHAKSADKEPGKDGKTYWKEGNSYTLVATEVLLATNAYIKFMSGNAIQLYDQNNEVAGEFSGAGHRIVKGVNFLGWLGNLGSKLGTGNWNPAWAVNDLGQMFVGGTSGQRIELDPLNRSMDVYDSDGNLVARHSGRVISLAEAVPPGADASPAEVQLSAKSIVNMATSGSEAYQNQYEQEMFTLNTPSGTGAKRTLNLPAMTVGGYVSGVSAGKVTVRVIARAYDGATKVMESVVSSNVFSGTSTSNGASVAARSMSLPSATTKVVLVLQAYATAMGGLGTATFSSTGKMTVTSVADWYRCEYGANGWVISQNSLNYEYCLVDNSGKLHRKIVSNGTTILTT